MATLSNERDWKLRRGKNGGRWYIYDIPMDGNDVLLSPAIDLIDYAEVAVNIDTDVDCTLWMDLSLKEAPDPKVEADWDRNIPRIVNQEIGTGGIRTLLAGSSWMRIRVVNGSSSMTHLRILVKLNTASGTFTSTPNQVLSIFDQVTLSREINKHSNDVARGLFSDQYSVNKFGSNPAVGTGSFEGIWAAGGPFNWLTTASAVRVASGGNSNDTAAGTGARSITIEGLDENWNLASETVVTAGASASAATTTTFIRVFRAYVATAGTYTGNNAGAVTIETTGGTTLAFITADLGQSQIANYSVPAGYTALMTDFSVLVDGSKAAQVQLFKRENADTVAAPFAPKRLQRNYQAIQGSYVEPLQVPITFPEKTDIWWEAIGGGGSVTTVEVNFSLELINSQSVVPQ